MILFRQCFDAVGWVTKKHPIQPVKIFTHTSSCKSRIVLAVAVVVVAAAIVVLTVN